MTDPPSGPAPGGEWASDAAELGPAVKLGPAAEPGVQPAPAAEPGPGVRLGPAAEPGSGVQPGPAAERGTDAEPAAGAGRGQAGERNGITLTGRGAIAGMLVLFFLSLLLASWLQWGVLAGPSFVIGSVGAAWYTRRRDLLVVAVSPPLLFFLALIVVKALTAKGSTIISTVAGTALTLANVAPWLFAGVIVYVIVAWVRGLPQCVTDLRHDLRPDLAQPRPGTPGAAGSRAVYQPGPRHYR